MTAIDEIDQIRVSTDCGQCLGDGCVSRIRHHAACCFAHTFAPALFLRGDVSVVVESRRIEHTSLVSSFHVEYPQLVERIVAIGRAGKDDSSTVRRHGDVAWLTKGERCVRACWRGKVSGTMARSFTRP